MRSLIILLSYVFAIVAIAAVLLPEDDGSHEHHHGRHHKHGRRVPSKLADLKDRILHGYDNVVNPDHKVVVTMGFNLLDIHLCAHKQVNFWFVLQLIISCAMCLLVQ